MKDLGRAMHTLQDSTSPSHHGFQPWYNYWGGGANPNEWLHAAAESIDPGVGSWLYEATLEAYKYFKSSDPLPTEFFDKLGSDTVGDQFKGQFRKHFGTWQYGDVMNGGSLGGAYGIDF